MTGTVGAVAIESRSPQDPGDVVVRAAAADAGAVRAASEVARAAQRGWQASALARADALHAAGVALEASADDLVDLVVREVGKPVGEARLEVQRGARILRYYAQSALDDDGDTYPAPGDRETLLMSRRRPHGVAGLITPWNFPVAIPLWKAAPALACGNAVILKPSSEALACALRLQEILAAALPAGLFAVVAGEAETGQAVTDAVDAVSFTGSTAVGFAVAAAGVARGIPVQCEMGGVNASIVLEDADVSTAATMVAQAAMGYAGQKCTATSRAIVVGDPAPFIDALAAAVEALPVGDPRDPATVVGPVITPAARKRVGDAVARAVAEAGDVAAGGRALDGDGWYVAPTVIRGQAPQAELAREEVFGPIATVLGAASAEEAVTIANDVPQGLVTSVFTSDLDRALHMVDDLDTGMVRVNQPTSGVDFHVPFGGEKRSSIGPREQGRAARDFYTSTRTIAIAPSRS